MLASIFFHLRISGSLIKFKWVLLVKISSNTMRKNVREFDLCCVGATVLVCLIGFFFTSIDKQWCICMKKNIVTELKKRLSKIRFNFCMILGPC